MLLKIPGIVSRRDGYQTCPSLVVRYVFMVTALRELLLACYDPPTSYNPS